MKLMQQFHNMSFDALLIASAVSEEIYLQSQELLIPGIYEFMLKIKQDFFYESYHSGIKCTIASLSQNRITSVSHNGHKQQNFYVFFFFTKTE